MDQYRDWNIPWEYLDLRARLMLQRGGYTEGVYTDEVIGGAVNVAGTLEDPGVYVAFGTAGAIAFAPALKAGVTTLSVRCLLSPVCAAITGNAGAAGTDALNQGADEALQVSDDLASQLRFTGTTARYMNGTVPGRYVPRTILSAAIQTGERMPDPQGAPGAVKIVTTVWRYGSQGGAEVLKPYRLEVVYREADHTVLHFMMNEIK